MLIGPNSMLQERYLKSRTKKLEDNNTSNNNANIAQTKTKPVFSKKQGQKQPKFMTRQY